MLPPISKEQSKILDTIREGHNLQVDAVAGSGKTTTSLYIAQQFPGSILLLTYNARLKMETRQKVESLGMTNMEVHSYHAFCVKHFDPKAYTDTGILAFLNKTKTTKKKFSYGLVLVDEAQDMNPLYFRVVQRILMCCGENSPQLVIMGDRKQSIYGFNRADPRFLTLAPSLFASNNTKTWKRATLSTSYRITKPMASLVTDCCRGALPVRSIKNGDKVRYIACGMYGARPLKEIEYYMKRGFEPEDIFVLAGSVKSSKSPVRVLANRLTEKGVSIYVPTSDDEKLDEEVLRNKIVFSTFHQVKGLERAVVLVFDFSENYFKYCGKDLPVHEIPNTVYVAITRARVALTVFHDDTSPYFSFLDRQRLESCCTIEKSKRFREDRVLSVVSNVPDFVRVEKRVPLTELTKYLPVDILEDCLSTLSVKKVGKKSTVLEVPMKSKQGESYESVGDINSIALFSYFEYTRTGSMTIADYLGLHRTQSSRASLLLGRKEEEGVGTRLLGTKGEDEDITVDHLLRLSTRWVSEKSGYDFKNSQVRRFDWLEKDMLDDAVRRLSRCFPDTGAILDFEKKIFWNNLEGFVDVWDKSKKEAWMVRMVTELGPEHFLQAAMSSWLLQKTGVTVHKTYVYNIRDEERSEISFASSALEVNVGRLRDYKEASMTKKDDDVFLRSIRCLFDGVK